jgi:hypothetical protein
MDDLPIEIHVVANLDESTRVNVRGAIASPIGVIMSAVVLMFCIFMVFLAAAIMMGSTPDYVFGPIIIVIALLLPVASYLRFKFLIRSKLKTVFEATSWGEAVYTEDTFDYRDGRGNIHLDWTPFKWAKRIPEGVLIGFGSTRIFYSHSYFADGDFDRFLTLLRYKLGARAKV